MNVHHKKERRLIILVNVESICNGNKFSFPRTFVLWQKLDESIMDRDIKSTHHS